MSLPQLAKQIARLSYGDMMILADEFSKLLQSELGISAEKAMLAFIISTLQKDAVEALNKQEHNLLSKVFNRKRTISVERDGNGWTVDITTVNGARASALDLREALTRCIDQVVTLEALRS